MTPRARGFTLLEMVVCVSILATLVPLAFLFLRALSLEHEQNLWRLRVAEDLRVISEALRVDAGRGLPDVASPGPGGAEGDGAPVSFQGERGCGPVRYLAEKDVLWRVADEACGGRQALARGVSALRRVRGAVEVEFALRLAPGRSASTRELVGLRGVR